MLSLLTANLLTTVLNKMRILLITKNSLLGDVLENLLSHQKILRIQQPARINYEKLFQSVVAHEPEIIILEEGLMTGKTGHFISRVLKLGCKRTIWVSPNENQVHVFDNFPVLLNQSTDLTSLIKGFSDQRNNVV